MGFYHKRFNVKSHEYLAMSIGGIPISTVHKVEGFIHRPGVHCDSSALRDVFEYGFIEEYGTGGGYFRYLYSKFLKEAGEVFEDERLTNLSKKYYEVGEKWTQVARLIRDIPRMAKRNSEEAWRILLEIADEEKNILRSLEKVAEK